MPRSRSECNSPWPLHLPSVVQQQNSRSITGRRGCDSLRSDHPMSGLPVDRGAGGAAGAPAPERPRAQGGRISRGSECDGSAPLTVAQRDPVRLRAIPPSAVGRRDGPTWRAPAGRRSPVRPAAADPDRGGRRRDGQEVGREEAPVDLPSLRREKPSTARDVPPLPRPGGAPAPPRPGPPVGRRPSLRAPPEGEPLRVSRKKRAAPPDPAG